MAYCAGVAARKAQRTLPVRTSVYVDMEVSGGFSSPLVVPFPVEGGVGCVGQPG